MRTDQKLFCLKLSLVLFIVLLLLFGAVLFGVPLWLLLDYWSNEYLDINVEFQRYLIVLYVLIVVGGIILLFGFLGIVGAIRTNKWILLMLVIMVSIAAAMTAGGCVFGFLYKEELRNTGTIVADYIQQKYTGFQDRPTQIIDLMQSELNCCGGENFLDYDKSYWQKNDVKRDHQTPLSCCQDYERYQNAQGVAYTCSMYEGRDVVAQSRTPNPKIHKTGCKQALSEFFTKYVGVVVGVAIALFVIELTCVIIGSVLIHILRNLFVPQPDDIVYDMARKQEKSPYPSRGGYSGGGNYYQ
ncbi:tetraspanin-18 [Patella vulgata]|uniref:tetraspanin-18 n=1 Tax=Patella vulgata TaxID=6465 RepID=UPI00217FC16A|nr:tetraspanin-18 [Patella vulgata]